MTSAFWTTTPSRLSPQRASGDRERIEIEQRFELLEQRTSCTCRLERIDRVGAVGSDRAQHGNCLAKLVEEREEVDVDPRFDGGRLKVFDAIDGAADREHGSSGVAKCARRQDSARREVFVHHLDDAPTRSAREVEHLRAVGQHRCGTGKRHPERFADDVHRVGGAHAGAHTGSSDRVVAHPGERFLGELAEHRLHRADEHVFDVHVLALIVPARLIPADDEDGGDVEAACCHQMRGRRLVTRRQADHAVELRALDGDLHVVDDQVAAGQHVAASFGRADDEVAGRRGANLERKAAGLSNGVLDDACDAVQVAEADCQLRRAVHDGDLGLQHVGVAQPERLPLGAADGLARRAGLEVASQRFWHRKPRFDVIYQAAANLQ